METSGCCSQYSTIIVSSIQTTLLVSSVEVDCDGFFEHHCMFYLIEKERRIETDIRAKVKYM